MVVRLNVTLEIKLEISDEAELRTDAIKQLSDYESSEDSEYIRSAIADAKSGGWDFIQELLLIQPLLPDLAGVTTADETVSRPSIQERTPDPVYDIG